MKYREFDDTGRAKRKSKGNLTQGAFGTSVLQRGTVVIHPNMRVKGSERKKQ